MFGVWGLGFLGFRDLQTDRHSQPGRQAGRHTHTHSLIHMFAQAGCIHVYAN